MATDMTATLERDVMAEEIARLVENMPLPLIYGEWCFSRAAGRWEPSTKDTHAIPQVRLWRSKELKGSGPGKKRHVNLLRLIGDQRRWECLCRECYPLDQDRLTDEDIAMVHALCVAIVKEEI